MRHSMKLIEKDPLPPSDPLEGAGAAGWTVLAIWAVTIVVAFLIGHWTR